MTFEAVRTLTPAERKTNSKKYTEVLGKQFWPVLTKFLTNGCDTVQQDYPPPSGSKKWVSQSSDLNNTGSVWRTLKIRLHTKVSHIHSRQIC